MKACSMYEEFSRGAVSEERFRPHARTCPACRSLLAEDEILLAAARQLRPEPAPPEQVWAGVQRSLERARWKARAWWWGRVAAVLVVAAGAWTLSHQPKPGTDLLLQDQALARVEAAEQQYVAAIQALADQAATQPGPGDELGALLRQRLAVIEAQVARCRAAAQRNPGNPQVRQYLLAALREQKATLRQMLSRDGTGSTEGSHDKRI